MKQHAIVVFFSFVLLVSCKPKGTSPKALGYRPTQNGFGVVVQEIGIDSGPGAKLYYKGTNITPVLVWPSIGTAGYPILYTNDVALLLADKPDAKGYLGGSALIAVQGRGPAMDISNDILKIAADQAHVSFRTALKACRPLRLYQTSTNGIEVLFLGDSIIEPSIRELTAQITWERVFGIMQDVKKSGKTNKITNTDVLYLWKDYSSDQ